jgi:hypothetical protein
LEWEDVKGWHDVVQDEYNSLIKNKTLTLTKLPPSRHAIGCKWVFHIKFKIDGQVDKYNAQLIVKLISIRILMALVAKYDYEVHKSM